MKTTGVYELEPQTHSAFFFKQSIEVGELDVKTFPTAKGASRVDFDRDIWPIMEELMDKYRAYRYDMLAMNCNHFSDELL